MTGLFTDGGLYGDRNPSPVGGPWAFVYVDDDEIITYDCGFVSPLDYDTPVTNNITELEAAVRGLERYLHERGHKQPVDLYTDSMTTISRLRRPLRPKMKNVPDRLRQRLISITEVIKVRTILVAGHPTIEELRAGQTAKGTPVSYWNQYCDDLCNEVKRTHVPGRPASCV
jgi:ribonuclease HI